MTNFQKKFIRLGSKILISIFLLFLSFCFFLSSVSIGPPGHSSSPDFLFSTLAVITFIVSVTLAFSCVIMIIIKLCEYWDYRKISNQRGKENCIKHTNRIKEKNEEE